MFDRLIDVILNCFEWFIPFVVVDEFERAVVLRWGTFHREIGPDDGCRFFWLGEPTGFHWIIPCGIEHGILDNVVPRTINLKAQSLTTKCGKCVVIGAVVTARIKDIRRATLEVESVDNVLEDSCYGQVGALVAATAWADLHNEQFSETLTANCRKNAFRFGVEIMKVQLSDVAISRAIRLYQYHAKAAE